MNRTMNTYFFVLSLSILAFIGKGIMYLFISSYVPIILSLVVLGVFLISRRKIKLLIISIKFWAISLIVWSVLRIFIGVMNYFVKPFTENHLDQQLGIIGMVISIIFLWAGFYLLKKKHRNNWLQQSTVVKTK
ncbi:hypothetical protein [Winogradskyella sp. A3E31]|uniref:hypothetical protein n=1 Tax=Winogradskyella sp. A3E31 TaxID=3349637 RepID=UPI00398B16F9